MLNPEQWEGIRWHGEQLVMNLLNIQAPVIACINGPALRHPEIPLFADIVLAVQDSSVQDAGHFLVNAVPGDGMHIVFPALLGINRARYFLITGQTLNAQECKDLGLVSEILSRDELLPRARALAARAINQKSPDAALYAQPAGTTRSRPRCMNCWATAWRWRVWRLSIRGRKYRSDRWGQSKSSDEILTPTPVADFGWLGSE